MAGETIIALNAVITGASSESAKNNLMEQAISAVVGYPQDRRTLNRNFHPFVCMTDPDGSRLLIGDLKGTWDVTGETFTLESVRVLTSERTLDEMMNLVRVNRYHLNPGAIHLFSEPFRQLLQQREQEREEALKRVTISGAQESALA